MSLKDVCKHLDKILVEYFAVLDKIYATQHQLETVMKDGYFHMAKARYSMGSHSVTSMQYNLEQLEEARVHVIKEENTDAADTFHTILADQQTTNPASSTVRKRNILPDDDDDFVHLSNSVQDIQLDTMKPTSPTSPTPSKDPIKWFGILVPQALRQSQGQFKTAVELSVDLANLQSQYKHLHAEYCRLLKEKKALKKKADDSPSIEEYDQVDLEKEGLEEVK